MKKKVLVEKMVVVLAVVVFFAVCVAGNLLLDKHVTEPLMDKYTDSCIYTVEAEVVESTSNDCILLEDEEGWLWAMKGQDISVGTTGTLVMGATGLKINRMKSGPLGGDQQIGSMIACSELDLVIFLRDPLTAQPHEPDVSALLRFEYLLAIAEA